ncbi:MAG: adenylyl-sulfate kinase [Alphaproteobacteria bacterium PRO2]|nr:adenylyl-sulfate kinase [Alphaproteobacteria bacterium PRO2]
MTGEVDHGKSTIAGRLLHDTGSLTEGKIEELKEICERRGGGQEWSFLLDAFQDERNLAITIDTTQVRFKTAKRGYVLIDAPGHLEFLRNMFSGATEADAAVLVINAERGLQEQTRRHAHVLSLVGITQVIVAVNKMDAVGYNQEIFEKIAAEISKTLVPFAIVPISARHGEMIVSRGENMAWYQGPVLTEAFDALTVSAMLAGEPLRFSVQDVYRDHGRRILVGRVESGILKSGDELMFAPYGQMAKVESIAVWPDDPQKIEAHAGESIGIILDREILAERGAIASHADNAPALSHVLKAKIFRLRPAPFISDESLTARMGTSSFTVKTLSAIGEDMLSELTLRAETLQPVDFNQKIVLFSDAEAVGAGIVLGAGEYTGASDSKGQVFWFTGLSGAGKTTIAKAVEKELLGRGCKVHVLDGDELRRTISADLGFSPEDREENIRRASAIAARMAASGTIVIAAFISPSRAGRKHAREAAKGWFHEIYIKADLATCEKRDPKGLYKKARAGKITDFTGIDSPYELPEKPDLVVDTQNGDIEEGVQAVLRFIEERAMTPGIYGQDRFRAIK